MNREPVQAGQNWRDGAVPRLLCNNSSKGVLNYLKASKIWCGWPRKKRITWVELRTDCWLDGAKVSASGWGSGGPRFQSHPRLTFQSCSCYQGSEAASESTFSKSRILAGYQILDFTCCHGYCFWSGMNECGAEPECRKMAISQLSAHGYWSLFVFFSRKIVQLQLKLVTVVSIRANDWFWQFLQMKLVTI